VLQGRIDNPLDDVGKQQAAEIARILPSADVVISSPLSRALQTAAYLSDSVEIDERWIELDYGEWDGLAVGDLPPHTWERWQADLDLRPPGGETIPEVGTRVHDALEELAGSNPPRHTVIVSHVSPIKAAVAWVLGVGDEISWRTRLGNASYTQIEVSKARRALVSFNVTAAG
ncbi:MAG: histidine phosphatase family protein, partial [Acidimicrobiales bacterium]